MAPPLNSHQPERILVRGVNWLGDAVMTTPALLRLREAKPNAHITLLTPEKLAGLWDHFPAINAVLTFAARESFSAVARRLRSERFQTALLFPNSVRAALEAWSGRIGRRIGFTEHWRNLLLTEAVPRGSGFIKMRKRSVPEIRRLVQEPALHRAGAYPSSAHQVHHYLQLVSVLGASAQPLVPRLVVTEQEVLAFAVRFGLNVDARQQNPVFGLNPGAEYGPAKRWPLERYAQAARQIHNRTGCRWIIFGGAADAAAARELEFQLQQSVAPGQNPVPVVNVAGQTSLRELCAGLKLCQLVITNDSGPMHVAAAVGTKVVVPFGSTAPALTGPGFPEMKQHGIVVADAPCAPCFLPQCPIDFRCMKGISVERIVDEALYTD